MVVVVLLIGYGLYSIIVKSGDAVTVTLCFGATGVVTYTTNRILKMWNEVIASVRGPALPADGGTDGAR